MLSKLMIGSKPDQIHVMVTKEFKRVLRQNWDMSAFPNTARQKPDPNNSKIMINFESEADFITTILRKEFGKTKFKFNFDMEINNPDW